MIQEGRNDTDNIGELRPEFPKTLAFPVCQLTDYEWWLNPVRVSDDDNDDANDDFYPY